MLAEDGREAIPDHLRDKEIDIDAGVTDGARERMSEPGPVVAGADHRGNT